MPINYPKAAALGLEAAHVTEAQFTAAHEAAGGGTNDLNPANSVAILNAVQAVIAKEKELDNGTARDVTLTLHPKLKLALAQ